MSSGWFNFSEPIRTIVQHRKPSPRLTLTGARSGSTFPNLFEPLSSRGNKGHRIISHEFGLVQLFPEPILPNLFEPLSFRGNKVHRTIFHEFGVVQLFRTCSKHSSTQETRTAVELDMSSGSLIFPNRFEPQSYRGNKVHRIISHEFGVVQPFQTLWDLWAPDGTRIIG